MQYDRSHLLLYEIERARRVWENILQKRRPEEELTFDIADVDVYSDSVATVTFHKKHAHTSPDFLVVFLFMKLKTKTKYWNSITHKEEEIEGDFRFFVPTDEHIAGLVGVSNRLNQTQTENFEHNFVQGDLDALKHIDIPRKQKLW